MALPKIVSVVSSEATQRSVALLCVVGLLVFGAFVTLAASPLTSTFGYDQEVFRYAGMVISNGGKLYIDVFDHKPPLIYLIAAAGHPFGFWGFWVMERLTLALGAILFFIFLRASQIIFAFGQALLFLILMSLPGLYPAGGGVPRVFAGTLTLTALMAVMGSNKNKYMVAGICSALLLLLQQELALPAIGFATMVAYLSHQIGALKSFVGGIALVGLPIMIWLVINGSFVAFVQEAFLFNFTYVSLHQDLWERMGSVSSIV